MDLPQSTIDSEDSAVARSAASGWRPQFRLSTLLLLTAIVAMVLGWWRREADFAKERSATVPIVELAVRHLRPKFRDVVLRIAMTGPSGGVASEDELWPDSAGGFGRLPAITRSYAAASEPDKITKVRCLYLRSTRTADLYSVEVFLSTGDTPDFTEIVSYDGQRSFREFGERVQVEFKPSDFDDAAPSSP